MRKVELGAGIAAAVLSVVGMLVLLFGPLVSYCADRVNNINQCPDIRNVSLAQAGLTAEGWAFTFGMLVFTLLAAAGAVGEARFGIRDAALALWAGGALLLAACVLTAGNIGLFYLPSVLALGLATYASIVRRMNERQRSASSAANQSSPGA